MTAMSPWRGLMPLTPLRREMDRLFERFLEPSEEMAATSGEWAPSLDISENKDALVVKAEVPGVDPKDIEISLLGDYLTVKGEKRYEKEEKDEKYHRVERSYGSFMRAVRLPAATDAGKVSATFKNGLLTITLPKTPAAKGTFIPVKAE